MPWTPNMPQRAAAFAAARPTVYTIVAVAYDQKLAGRISSSLAAIPS